MRCVKVFQRERSLRTAGGLQVRDITDEVNAAVRESGITDGIACVYSPHTTCCVRVNEFESGFRQPSGVSEPTPARPPSASGEGPPRISAGRAKARRDGRSWARLDSNQGPTDYESAALTN